MRSPDHAGTSNLFRAAPRGPATDTGAQQNLQGLTTQAFSAADVIVARRDLDAMQAAQEALEDAVSGSLVMMDLQRDVQKVQRSLSVATTWRTANARLAGWASVQEVLQEMDNRILDRSIARLARRDDDLREAVESLRKLVASAFTNVQPIHRQANPNVPTIVASVGAATDAMREPLTLIGAGCRNLSFVSLREIGNWLQSIFSRMEHAVGPEHQNRFGATDASGEHGARAINEASQHTGARLDTPNGLRATAREAPDGLGR